MERLSFINKKTVAVFAIMFVLGIVSTMIPVAIIKVHHIPAFAYLIIIILWSGDPLRQYLQRKAQAGQ